MRHILQQLRHIVILLPLIMAGTLRAEPASTVPPKSIFVMPESPKDGRDPFFPNSMRPYESAPNAKNVDNSLLKTLEVKSILNGGNGEVLAIVNNHTFAPGDEGTVITDDGQRVTIRCLDINPNHRESTNENSKNDPNSVCSRSAAKSIRPNISGRHASRDQHAGHDGANQYHARNGFDRYQCDGDSGHD